MSRWAKYLIVAALAIVLLVASRGILGPFIVAVATAYIFSPLVDRVQAASRLPRVVVVITFYLIFIGIVAALISFVQPELARQARGAEGLFTSSNGVSAAVLDRVSQNEQLVAVLQRTGVDIVPYGEPTYPERRTMLAMRLQAEFRNIFQPRQVRDIAQTTFDYALKLIVWFFSTFYLLLNGRNAMEFFIRFVPEEYEAHTRSILERIHAVLGRYMRGQLYLILIMFIASYIALRLYGIPYALPIALGTGILEVIPFVGPILAGTIACLVALATHGVGTMISVAVTYFVLREIEDQIVIPQVIGRVVHLDPVVTIFAVLAGQHIGGLIGVLLAVPMAAAARIILDDLFPPRPPRLPTAEDEARLEAEDLPEPTLMDRLRARRPVVTAHKEP